MNLVLINLKNRNFIGNINVNRLVYIYINERIISRPISPMISKLSYTYKITILDRETTVLEDVMMAYDNLEDL